MTFDWKNLFTRAASAWANGWDLSTVPRLQNLEALRNFLDLAHIKYGLVKPFCEFEDYPLIETRELLPSFEADLWEHKRLPGFSLVAFERPLRYFTEVFQFDLLNPVDREIRMEHAQRAMASNLAVLQSRLPRGLHDRLRQQFQKKDVTDLSFYSKLMPFLMVMDRGQVLSISGSPQEMHFSLTGIYASFPSNLDTEVKRFGLQIGKFRMDDHELYAQNRSFVLQYLMELYGYPVASERRTSAALFARRLHKMGERFLIRTLSQSDRVLTSIWNNGSGGPYPRVDKIGLISVEDSQDGMLEKLYDEGYFINEKKRVVIFKVTYHQHKFSPDNVRQERALSVESQEVIHPLTGLAADASGFIRDTTNMFLRLNDIVRGEHTGRIAYKRNEIVENTDTEEKRLKFLYAWLSKHQRRMIGYGDEFFAKIDKVVTGYLHSPENDDSFSGLRDLYQAVMNRYSYILQARKVRLLEDLQTRSYKNEHIGYACMLSEAVALLHSFRFEIVNYFDSLVATVIVIGESIIHNRYLRRTYLQKPDEALTQNGLEIKRNYGKLVSLIDDFKAIRRSRKISGL